MSKTRVFALILAMFLPTLVWSQQTDEKTPEKPAEKKVAMLPPSVRCEMAGTCVTKVFYPANIVSMNELQDAVNMLRTIVELQRVQMLPGPRAIVVKGSSEQLAQAEKLIDDIDRATKRSASSYRLEIKVSEFDGDKKTTRAYSAIVESKVRTRLSMGKRTFVDSGSDGKAVHQRIVGQNFGFQVGTEDEHTVVLKYELEFSPNIGASNDVEAAKIGKASASRTDNNVVRVEGRATLELGKPALLNTIDVDGHSTFQIEVKATQVKL